MNILIATDGSEFSRAAIKKCCEIGFKPEKTKIKIISVYQAYIPLDIFQQKKSVQYAEQFEKELRQKAEKIVNEAVSLLRECLPDESLEITTLLRMGATDRIIIETAKEWNADLIVVGSHGLGFWGRTMIGSVSDSIIHHAPCSVLVVRKSNLENNP